MQMFTRQHYKILAEILGKAQDKKEAIALLIEYFKNDNPNFNKTKFIQAIIDSFYRTYTKLPSDIPYSELTGDTS